MLFTRLLPALALGAAASAAAAPVAPRDVYVPKVLYPHTGTVWYSGQRHNVTWCAPPHSFLYLTSTLTRARDNSNPPQTISNRAFVLLRQDERAIPGEPLLTSLGHIRSDSCASGARARLRPARGPRRAHAGRW